MAKYVLTACGYVCIHARMYIVYTLPGGLKYVVMHTCMQVHAYARVGVKLAHRLIVCVCVYIHMHLDTYVRVCV
jgi:hypothetical protein